MAYRPAQKMLHQNGDQRIKTLLSTTNMTFKQIVDQMRQENIKVSLNDIRRVNKDNLYRKKRYDSKLTLSQRKQLIKELMNPHKPNLTALAEKYGVCHGSIWYWSDKMERIRARNNGIIPFDHPILVGPSARGLAVLQPKGACQDYLSGPDSADSGHNMGDNNTGSAIDTDDDYSIDVTLISPKTPDDWMDNEQEELEKEGEEEEEECYPLNLTAYKNRKPPTETDNYVKDDMGHNKCSFYEQEQELSLDDCRSLNPVGPVQALNLLGQFVTLPIMMYTTHSPAISPDWSSVNSTSGIQEQPIDATTPSNNNAPLCLKRLFSQVLFTNRSY